MEPLKLPCGAQLHIKKWWAKGKGVNVELSSQSDSIEDPEAPEFDPYLGTIVLHLQRESLAPVAAWLLKLDQEGWGDL